MRPHPTIPSFTGLGIFSGIPSATRTSGCDHPLVCNIEAWKLHQTNPAISPLHGVHLGRVHADGDEEREAVHGVREHVPHGAPHLQAGVGRHRPVRRQPPAEAPQHRVARLCDGLAACRCPPPPGGKLTASHGGRRARSATGHICWKEGWGEPWAALSHWAPQVPMNGGRVCPPPCIWEEGSNPPVLSSGGR